MSTSPAPLAQRIARLRPNEAARGRALGDAIFAALCQGLREGLFLPGERLREEEIAAAFDVSRTPVRDALRRMLERRLLEVSGGRGLMLRRLGRADVMELYQMREIMEGTAARLAAMNITPAETELLDELQQQAASETEPATLARLNKRFHDTIAAAVRNRYFHGPLDDLQDFLALLGTTTYSDPSRARPALEEHDRILSALKSGDAEQAEAAARAHIRAALATRLRLPAD